MITPQYERVALRESTELLSQSLPDLFAQVSGGLGLAFLSALGLLVDIQEIHCPVRRGDSGMLTPTW